MTTTMNLKSNVLNVQKCAKPRTCAAQNYQAQKRFAQSIARGKWISKRRRQLIYRNQFFSRKQRIQN